MANTCDTVLAGLLIGVTAFLLQRRRRHRHDTERDKERERNAPLFGQISAPNGLDPGNIPPTYQEALKSPVISNTSVPMRSDHQRQRSDAMLMDECMMAIYAAEDGRAGSSSRGGRESPTATSYTGLADPTSPRGVAQGNKRQSVSRWLRNQRWTSSAGPNPLTSHPQRTPMTAELPVPPSPSYTGISSVPQTPMSGSRLAPPFPYVEPLSARSTTSWMTGDDRLSIRASIPNSVLYPSPLQPAPPPRRLATEKRNRESVSSVQEYGGETWKTMTPHEDPPEYEPRRGDPDTVSPV